MPSQPYSGTQTAVIGTEHVLNTTTPETTAGIYQFFVDISAMLGGDTLELRVKEKAIGAGGTQRTVFTAPIANVPSADENMWVSPALLLMHGWDFTLKQTAGVGRAFPWSIRKA